MFGVYSITSSNAIGDKRAMFPRITFIIQTSTNQMPVLLSATNALKRHLVAKERSELTSELQKLLKESVTNTTTLSELQV